MAWKGIRDPIRYALLASLLGATTSVIIVGAVLLAAYNMPEQTPDSNSTSRTVGSGVILLASLLATAPLIGWWYNHFNRWLNVLFGADGDNHESEN